MKATIEAPRGTMSTTLCSGTLQENVESQLQLLTYFVFSSRFSFWKSVHAMNQANISVFAGKHVTTLIFFCSRSYESDGETCTDTVYRRQMLGYIINTRTRHIIYISVYYNAAAYDTI